MESIRNSRARVAESGICAKDGEHVSQAQLTNRIAIRAGKRGSRIAQVGAGVVGMSCGKSLSYQGFPVVFVDIAESVCTHLREQGYQAFYPDDFDANGIDIFFVSVPTYADDDPSGLSHLKNVAEQIGQWLGSMANYAVVVIRSTIMPGTTEELVIPILERASGKYVGADFGVCVNPEYLREKQALDDFLNPPTVVIGAYDKKCGAAVERLYDWVKCPIQHVSLREAELQKVVHNVFNAAKISFFNEIREVCALSGVDSDKIFPLVCESAEGMRVPTYGTRDLGPYRGMCLPKDTRAFLAYSENIGLPASLVRAVVEVNEKCKTRLANAAESGIG